jgi:hypothetical protein
MRVPEPAITSGTRKSPPISTSSPRETIVSPSPASTLSISSAADFMRRLDSSPYFQKVELQVIEQAGQGGRKLQKFSLNCNVESPAAKPKNP